jgi:hypothetical protein
VTLVQIHIGHVASFVDQSGSGVANSSATATSGDSTERITIQPPVDAGDGLIVDYKTTARIFSAMHDIVLTEVRKLLLSRLAGNQKMRRVIDERCHFLEKSMAQRGKFSLDPAAALLQMDHTSVLKVACSCGCVHSRLQPSFPY